MDFIVFNSKPAIRKLVLIPALLLTITTCLKVEPEKTIIIQTLGVTDISNSSCTATGEVYDGGKGGMTEHGFCWSTTQDPTINSPGKKNLGAKNTSGEFTASITGLSTNTKYYIKAYGKDSNGIKYGDQKEFTTTSGPSLPTLTTATISGITQITAQAGGDITSDGGATVTARGVCWSTSQNPTTSNSKTTDGTGTGSFISNLTGLDCAVSYYVRAYATNSAGTSYGNQVSFSSLQCTAGKPAVTTGIISGITEISAEAGGNVTGDGGATVTSRGVCWSMSQSPTLSDNFTTDGSGTGTYTSSITGLACGTTYYVRAYASNGSGTAYGTQQSFQTSECASVKTPTVSSTTSVTNISQTSCQTGGMVSADGGASVTAKGVCWSRSQYPTISESKTSDGTGTGSFISVITGLDCNTAYYVRAYATNSSGTSYGSEINFSTLQCTIDPPVITTTAISGITKTNAQGGGNVTSEGGTPVTAKGVCWSTSPNPTVSGSKTTDGSGLGSFTSTLTGLSCNTTFYVRAYATTSEGTVYGTQVYFNTLTCGTVPTVSTNSITSIDGNSAVGGGNVTSDGGMSVTDKGVCWSTSTNPTVTDSKTTDGSGTGSFTSNLTGLDPLTTYYVRAYATNGEGTAYGNQVTCKTTWDNSTVTDYDGNEYTTVLIGEQVWMKENLKVTHFSNGTAIPHVTGTSAWVALGSTGQGYCWYNNEISNGAIYGALYTWSAASNGSSSNANQSGVQGVCPSGWHLPSDEEWKQLEIYLGMNPSDAEGLNFRGNDEGGKMKESGSSHWADPNEGATNSSGFTGLPAGARYADTGGFNDLRATAYYWSATSYNSTDAWYRGLGYFSEKVHRYNYKKQNGFSIRCVRDN